MILFQQMIAIFNAANKWWILVYKQIVLYSTEVNTYLYIFHSISLFFFLFSNSNELYQFYIEQYYFEHLQKGLNSQQFLWGNEIFWDKQIYNELKTIFI